MEKIAYKIKTAEKNEIITHLKINSDFFIPPLKERVNIENYSEKIFKHSITFEAWANKQLIGIIATYFNKSTLKGFITNVSVLHEFTGAGISSVLLKMCIEYAIKYNFAEIDLEVHCKNKQAINLYKKFGFSKYSNIKDIDSMKVAVNKTKL